MLNDGFLAGDFVSFHAYPYYPDFLLYPLAWYNVSAAYVGNITLEDPYYLCLAQLKVNARMGPNPG